jgi:cysteine desulfurase/selenocysteine lyase
VFTRGTTESINLVAASFVRPRLGKSDEIVVTTMEHHSNIVPWQMLCAETGARLMVCPVSDSGELMLDELGELLSERTRLVAVCHTSNALGTINPIREITALAHDLSVPVLVDGAQAVPHGPVDVRDLDCDFFCFSGHKMFGPMGIGILYARWDHLERMPPYQGGGDMIETVSFSGTTYADAPSRFEAGTPNVAGAVGLAAAIDYLNSTGLGAIGKHERDLLHYGNEALAAVPGLRMIGTAARKVPVFSFIVDELHPYDVGTLLDRQGIAVRTGHHCTEPLMRRFGVPGTVRASLAFYNSREDLDALVTALGKAIRILA